jgi:hypothetical protein
MGSSAVLTAVGLCCAQVVPGLDEGCRSALMPPSPLQVLPASALSDDLHMEAPSPQRKTGREEAQSEQAAQQSRRREEEQDLETERMRKRVSRIENRVEQIDSNVDQLQVPFRVQGSGFRV